MLAYRLRAEPRADPPLERAGAERLGADRAPPLERLGERETDGAREGALDGDREIDGERDRLGDRDTDGARERLGARATEGLRPLDPEREARELLRVVGTRERLGARLTRELLRAGALRPTEGERCVLRVVREELRAGAERVRELVREGARKTGPLSTRLLRWRSVGVVLLRAPLCVRPTELLRCTRLEERGAVTVAREDRVELLERVAFPLRMLGVRVPRLVVARVEVPRVAVPRVELVPEPPNERQRLVSPERTVALLFVARLRVVVLRVAALLRTLGVAVPPRAVAPERTEVARVLALFADPPRVVAAERTPGVRYWRTEVATRCC